MESENLSARIDKFERTVATCLCAFPILFSAQCVLVALATPTFSVMFADFGAKLPEPTQFVLDTWGLWIALGVVIPVGCLILARKGNPTTSVILSTILGLVLFLLAQALTAGLLMPIFHLGAVSGSL